MYIVLETYAYYHGNIEQYIIYYIACKIYLIINLQYT